MQLRISSTRAAPDCVVPSDRPEHVPKHQLLKWNRFRAVISCGEIKPGESVRYEERPYIVRGFTHASSSTQYVILEDDAMGERKTVPLADVTRS